ncbi:type I restriction-modification system subunit M N-terminal domain-containing protein [Pseudomonas putida]|uniref:Type I restriction-modification system n=1 Tax=Pseudomonas putida (strain DOT-T1E) TaxID=1196325 RepID=I7C0E3_PSEPT|nr:type I restriction-modification system subunit M N-terminal domain-containing protein [Pseudomonas putida]AFO46531.1 type I restriction-modification system [Pseudomonas putida DOT-T1E]
MRKIHELSNFIWSIADLLRDAYRLSQYERVLLPLVVLRRFDCVLESTKEAVLASYTQYKGKLNDEVLDSLLNNVSGQRLHNHSPLSFKKMKDDPYNVHLNLISYINGFSKKRPRDL